MQSKKLKILQKDLHDIKGDTQRVVILFKENLMPVFFVLF